MTRSTAIAAVVALGVLTAPAPAISEATSAEVREPPSWSFPDIVDSAREITPRNVEGRPFDRFGLAYPKAELEAVRVAGKSAHELQRYADVVTHAYPDAVFRMMRASCQDVALDELNTTAWGGVAYVSLNAVTPAVRVDAAKCFATLTARMNAGSVEP